MARSPAHKWGQIIGQEFLEVALEPVLRAVADEHGLYMDVKGDRPARTGKKIAWQDDFGNNHDLDFVLERGGTADKIGDPVAFIETAWRRYTKHSRNKAQEVQGAVLPLATRHHRHAPLVGVILAGAWTPGAIRQLNSLGFKTLHFEYDDIVKAFAKVGIDARFGEDTPDTECAAKVRAWNKLTGRERQRLGQRLLAIKSKEVNAFLTRLAAAITRQIELIRILPLHGASVEHSTVEAAIEYVEQYDEALTGRRPLVKYEVQVRYNNADLVNAQFSSKQEAVTFLSTFLPAVRPVTGKSDSRSPLK